MKKYELRYTTVPKGGPRVTCNECCTKFYDKTQRVESFHTQAIAELSYEAFMQYHTSKETTPEHIKDHVENLIGRACGNDDVLFSVDGLFEVNQIISNILV